MVDVRWNASHAFGEGHDMSDLTNFWRGLLETSGHTGWADAKIYAFDQLCRLKRFEEWLDRQALQPGKALDFGCGSGDFSRFLVRRGWQVTAYDRYVSPRHQHPQLTPTQSLVEVAARAPYDLILSVTVLDCIMDDADFSTTLARLREQLRPGGKFFFLEYAGDVPRERSQYQGFRLYSDWQSELSRAGLNLSDVAPFFHPKEAPVSAWDSYSRMLAVRALTRAHRHIRKSAYARSLRPFARMSMLLHPYETPLASPVKIMSGSAA